MSTSYYNFVDPIGSAWVDTSHPPHVKVGLFDNSPTPALVGILTFKDRGDATDFLYLLRKGEAVVVRSAVGRGQVYYQQFGTIEGPALISEYGHIIRKEAIEPFLGKVVENIDIGENWC